MRLFGTDLEVLMDHQARARLPGETPYIFQAACEFLHKAALQTPGIFRQEPEQREVGELLRKLDLAHGSSQRVDFAQISANAWAVASVVKKFVRELPRPLLTPELCPYFLACGDAGGNDLTRLGQLADLLGRLPPAYFRSTELLLTLLHATATQNAVMNASELAKIFAPLLLRPGAPLPPADLARATAVTTLLITNGAAGGALLATAAQNLAAGGDGVGAVTAGVAAANLGGGGGAPPPAAPAGGNANAEWYYIDAEQNYVGPVDAAGLRQLHAHGYVTAESHCWAEHLSGWQMYSAIAELQGGGGGRAAPPARVAASAQLQPQAAAASPPAIKPVAPAAPRTSSASQDAAARAAAQSNVNMCGGRGVAGSAAGARATVGGGGPSAACGVAAPPSLGMARKNREAGAAEPLSLGGRGAQQTSAADRGRGATNAPPPPPGAPRQQTVSGTPLNLTPQAAATAAALQAGAPPPQPEQSAQAGGVNIPSIDMECAPYKEGEWSGLGIRLCDAEGRVRAQIAEDGEVCDGRGATLAYIEGNGEVGDPEMQYVGKVHMSGQIMDHNDKIVGEYDQGRGYIKGPNGSVIAELSKEGVFTNNAGVTLGCFEGFSYDQLTTVAAYIILVDRACVKGQGVFG